MSEVTMPEQSALLRAYKAIEGLQVKLAAAQRSSREPIAVVGMGCRLPGGVRDPESLWSMLKDGRDGIVEVPGDRWDLDAFFDPDPETPGTTYSRWGAFLDDVYGFDASFFGISPREAEEMDPQHRLLLEVAWEALERAGQTQERLAGSRTAVTIGIASSDFLQLRVGSTALDEIDTYLMTGASFHAAAGRLSYVLGLQGPSMVVDTACSSSLVAVHLACHFLRAREADLAISGGVSALLSPFVNVATSRARLLAPDGRCKTFDARADGYVRGEGCGIIVLRRLEDALADGDEILAVIRGSAVNQDGRSSGLTVPNGLAQRDVLSRALANAGVVPEQVGMIEAHGTGTSLGDPIEVEAIAEVLGKGRSPDRPLMLGSIKTNIGHLEGAAGIAGLMKLVLALRHRTVPPHLNFERLNPHIQVDGVPITVPTQCSPWPASDGPRLGGVSSFGVVGTNAHVILEEPPATNGHAPEESTAGRVPSNADRAQLLVLSARDQVALRQSAARHAAYLERLVAPGASGGADQGQSGFVSLDDVVSTAASRRSAHPHRLAVAGGDVAELRGALEAFAEGREVPGVATGQAIPGSRPKVVLVFPGQGSQWHGMARQLLRTEPVFRECLEQIDRAYGELVDWSLLEELEAGEPGGRIDDIDVIQPALFAIEVGLARLWRSWGIVPAALIGHSMGEVAAAHVAGILSLEDAARVICRRSRLLRRVSGKGAMSVIELGLDQARAEVAGMEGRLSVAVSNSPRSTVLSGDPEAIEEVLERLEGRGVFCRRVKVEVASHGPQMDCLLEDLQAELALVTPRQGELPVYSTVTGEVEDGEVMDAGYWARNLRQPVLFSGMVTRLLEEGHQIFLEVTPHPILVSAVEETAREVGREVVALGSLRREEDERASLLATLGGMWTRGVAPSWGLVLPGRGHVADLPTYPWQHERHLPPSRGRCAEAGGHPLLGPGMASSLDDGTYLWSRKLGLRSFPFLSDHRVQDVAVLPAAAYIEMALAAGREAMGPSVDELRNVEILEPMILDADAERVAQTVLVDEGAGRGRFRVLSRPDGAGSGSWIEHARGKIGSSSAAVSPDGGSESAGGAGSPGSLEDPSGLVTQEVEATDRAGFYESLAARGLVYGECFRSVAEIWKGTGKAVARLELPSKVRGNLGGLLLHPAFTDAALQSLAAAVLSGTGDDGSIFLPVGFERVRLHQDGGTHGWARARLSEAAEAASGGEEPSCSGQSEQQQVVGEVEVWDASGRPILEIEGFRSRAMPSSGAAGAAEVDRWLFEMSWVEASLPDEGRGGQELSGGGRTWLVLADRGSVGERLAGRLDVFGGRCVVVEPGQGEGLVELGPGRFRIDPADGCSYDQLLERAGAWAGAPVDRIVHLWSLEDSGEPETSSVLELAHRGIAWLSSINLIQALGRAGLRDQPRLWLVTRGAHRVVSEDRCEGLLQASQWGLARVIVHEHPGLRCGRVDLGAAVDEAQLDGLAAELLRDSTEDEVALRGSRRFVARLVRHEPDADSPAAADHKVASADHDAFRLDSFGTGVLDNLHFREIELPTPGPGQVLIRVCATALNFSDVFKAMGLMPGLGDGPVPFGAECAGTVAAIGPGVEGLAPGDEVVAMADSCLGSVALVPAELTALRPASLSPEDAVTIPVTFMTAAYALERLARLAPGERVLIHSATGGVGQAAIQLAQAIGAEIFATAGSEERREHLRSAGIQHVMSSRTTDFADEIMRITGGEGVDVVLNSLSGEGLRRSLECLGPYGRFVEIGKKDIYGDSRLGLYPFRQNLVLAAFDLDRVVREKAAEAGALLRELVQRAAAGAIRPLHRQTYPLSRTVDAFRSMAQARHLGKIVITVAGEQADVVPAGRSGAGLRDDGTYLIIGGLTGLGLEVARWLAGQGVRTLALVGRRAPSETADEILNEVRAAGVRIEVMQADVMRQDQLAGVLERIRSDMPPLVGLIQSAGILDDATILHQDQQRFTRVLGPKVIGTWHLHELTAEDPLDHFVMFSSAASMLGSPGQANHAAANAFLDGLAHFRRSRGLPAQSINWGPWAETGAAAVRKVGDRVGSYGVGEIDIASGLEAFARVLESGAPQVGVVPLDVRQWLQCYPHTAEAPIWARLVEEEDAARGIAAESTRESLLAIDDPAERRALLEERTRDQVAAVLRLDASRIDPLAPLGGLGFDSLMALELRNRLEAMLGVTLSATLIWAHPTVVALTTHLADKAGVPLDDVSASGSEDDEDDENDLDALVDALEDLSEDAADSLLGSS